MNNKDELEKIFSKAKNEANKFFSDIPYENMNKTVFVRLEHEKKPSLLRRHFKEGLIAEISVFAVCCVFMLGIIFFPKGEGDLENKEIASMGKPVSQQLIKLDSTDLYQWLHFFNIHKPDRMQENLFAVIWESGKNGDYKMAYSSLFENSSKPRPVEMIAFPDNQPSMVIISSQNDDKNYIHYRVIGYKKNKIMAYMEQNYVAGGEIEVINGVLKEKRLVPNNYVQNGNDGDMSQIITYYIPYQANEFGDIIPSVENLRINKGEHVAIIGDESTPIEALNSKLLLDWDLGSKLLNTSKNKNVKFLSAENPGREDLYIKTSKGGELKKISVEVVEQ